MHAQFNGAHGQKLVWLCKPTPWAELSPWETRRWIFVGLALWGMKDWWFRCTYTWYSWNNWFWIIDIDIVGESIWITCKKKWWECLVLFWIFLESVIKVILILGFSSSLVAFLQGVGAVTNSQGLAIMNSTWASDFTAIMRVPEFMRSYVYRIPDPPKWLETRWCHWFFWEDLQFWRSLGSLMQFIAEMEGSAIILSSC